ncbi:MAG: bifunctional glutamate N-acetyltransferase/amino-acid acetyltransferase ArgJ [Longicatena sp.]
MIELKENGICSPRGFRANALHCGIRKNRTKKDLSLIVSDVIASAASTYTQNKVKGAPIFVTKEHLKNGVAQAIICNSGNANTCNANGVEIANEMCTLCGDALHIKASDIIVASTGVIGEVLSIDPMKAHMSELVEGLHEFGGSDACEGIMTTDTFKKEFALSFCLDGKTCHIGGMAKGSGMIHPNMATMLAFITSDVAISSEMLNEMVHEVVEDTFNMVSVDGDTSTNDMLSMLANGLAHNKEITEKNEDYEICKQALLDMCIEISKNIAKDGEGATKLLTCEVVHGNTLQNAKAIAKSVITSSLFKAAMFGKDANWGRILCAIGYTPGEFLVDCINVDLSSEVGCIRVCEQGASCAFDEAKAFEILSADEITIRIDLQQGDAQATAWGCDLTYDYVKINGDYRT